MDLRDQLLESSDRKEKGAGKFSIASVVLHGGIVGFIIFMSATATHKVDAESKPIRAFLTSSAEPPPPKDEGPLRVGGDVKAPVVIKRVEPQYGELARHAKVQGVVIIEAIIDKDGNVDKVKVIKGLPMGLSETAEQAVREWKFKPGTLNGEPVDVIFNLTVNFTLQ